MIGLGVLNNQPPDPYQPALPNGIHLRWKFLRELGFPWYGFYLFRRPAQVGQPLCLSKITGGLKKGIWPENKLYTALGVLSSDANLVLTDEFTPANQVEFNLADRNHLRFELPEGEPARRIDLQIGFRAERCLDFQKLHPAPNPAPVVTANPTNVQGVSLTVKDSEAKPLSNAALYPVNTQTGPLLGLGCEYGLTVNLPAPCNAVDLLITIWEPVVPVATAYTFDAFDTKDNKVATKQLNVMASPANITLPAGRVMPISLAGPNIVRVEVSSVRNSVYLHRICGDNLNFGQRGKVLVKGTAFSGATPIRTFTLTGQTGQTITTSIDADAITAIEIGPCAGSLVDLCYVPVAQGATQGWQKLSHPAVARGVTYPIGLPVFQADYPCSVPNPQSLLTRRVRSALPPEWTAATFAELHDQLVDLVKGGPGATPMDERIFNAPPAVSNPPDPNPPKLSTFYILDMLLLGSLHPALAQLLGLYWIDQTALKNVAYDYLILADHTGVGQRDPDTVLATIQSSGFAQLDGFIVFNKSLSATANLSAPAGLETYELPGGTFPDVHGHLPQSSNNAGLRWELGWDNAGSLLPDVAVMYLVWRSYLGNADTPKHAGSYDLVTKIPPDKARPVLVTEPRIPNGLAPERSPDWPAVPLHFIDRNLPDGWYSYKVSGVDLFGRHSLNSAPAEILLRDKISPPMPAAVKADALDPDDPYLLRDDAHNDWYNSLDSVVRQTLIGLRVGWRWTPAHQQQAPHTKEFRIYFHPGVVPPDHDRAINWQERYYVVGYNKNFTIDSVNGDRVYEIFLPPSTATVLASVPLNPSLAEPVAHAYIGVTAADGKTHTADLRTTGNWANRLGNEGFVGPIAKIYRVWRTPPPPPGDVFTGERLYASPADYHNRSFFTYRWQPQPLLNLHVFRALDDAIFKADWSQRHLKPQLNESQLDLFPAGWNQATRQSVAGELNHLNTFVSVEGGTAQAMAYYRQLSDGALRVLAGLPSSEDAFVQLTINPLKPNDATNNNRLGPDNPDDLVLDMNHRAFIDTLDGRSTNCYFYRAAFVDDAHNLGPMGLSSPPVYLPNVVPPRAPVVTKVLSGDREITIKWASNREQDLAEYRVYRTDNEEDTHDLRLMTLVHTKVVADAEPLTRPADVSWEDIGLIGGSTFFYRITAVDSAQNESAPSPSVAAVVVDTSIPDPPLWVESKWILISEGDGTEEQWPLDSVISVGKQPVIRLAWKSDVVKGKFALTRRRRGGQSWKPIAGEADYRQISVSEYLFHDGDVSPDSNYIYRLRVTSSTGVVSLEYRELEVGRPKTK